MAIIHTSLGPVASTVVGGAATAALVAQIDALSTPRVWPVGTLDPAASEYPTGTEAATFAASVNAEPTDTIRRTTPRGKVWTGTVTSTGTIVISHDDYVGAVEDSAETVEIGRLTKPTRAARRELWLTTGGTSAQGNVNPDGDRVYIEHDTDTYVIQIPETA